MKNEDVLVNIKVIHVGVQKTTKTGKPYRQVHVVIRLGANEFVKEFIMYE